MTNSLANHCIQHSTAQQSFITPYSTVAKSSWGGREGFWTTRFFLPFCGIVAVPLLFSVSVGTDTYLANPPLLCLPVLHFTCIGTVLVPVHVVKQNHTEWHATPAFLRRKSTGRE